MTDDLITLVGMFPSLLRVCLLLILVLQMLHLPLPCPDLDGGCRGTPILSLADANAWHLLITGVRPNDDVDRGPFRTDNSERSRVPSDSPYGDLAISSASVHAISCGIELSRSLYYATKGVAFSRNRFDTQDRSFRPIEDVWISDARTLRAFTCIWLI